MTTPRTDLGVAARNAVFVRLPRRCSGTEIVATFEAAAQVSVNECERWIGARFHTGAYRRSHDGTIVAHQGVHATPSYLQQRSKIAQWLFGPAKTTWRTESGGDIATFATQITLLPLDPSEMYDEVLVTIEHQHSFDGMMVGCRVASSPIDPAFAEYRPMFDRILQTFTTALDAPPTSVSCSA